MDPWASHHDTPLPNPVSTEFEDNFAPDKDDRLPDSAAYLASLENRLRRLRADPDILRQLSEKREACMQALLSGEGQYFEDDLNAPVALQSSQLVRSLLPQKQALNQGEIVELIKYDQLSNDNLDGEDVKSLETIDNRSP